MTVYTLKCEDGQIAGRSRLDCLDELIGSGDMAHDIAQCLSKLPKDLDKYAYGRPGGIALKNPTRPLCQRRSDDAWAAVHRRMCGNVALRPGRNNSDPTR